MPMVMLSVLYRTSAICRSLSNPNSTTIFSTVLFTGISWDVKLMPNLTANDSIRPGILSVGTFAIRHSYANILTWKLYDFPSFLKSDSTTVGLSERFSNSSSNSRSLFWWNLSSLATSSPWTLFMFFKHVCKVSIFSLCFFSAFSNFLILFCSVSIASGGMLSSAIFLFFLFRSIVSSLRFRYSRSLFGGRSL